MSGKYDNTYKREVLLQEIDKRLSVVKRDLYFQSKRHYIDYDGEVVGHYDINSFDEFMKPYQKGFNALDCANRLIESKYRRAKRVRDKISDLVINNDAIFITLTFNDRILSQTDALTRRRLVQRYLKRNCIKYVANVDFGTLKGREHYHAVVSNDIVFDSWYKYGAINAERVRPLDNSSKRISRYITKLTNHALKVEGVQPRLIYSRDIV